MEPLRMWGGVECSHVRLGDAVRDQCVETGHRERPGDLDLIAETGVRTLRYPVIWGSVARGSGYDFTWTDARFARLRALGIRPIAGLLHHGWGPGDLHPLHSDFVRSFADYAEAVALRYPWVVDFTPINEPVTTARFSYLYGHWYPHIRDEAAFLRAVVACAEATAAAMRRIRRHTPGARLVQTEDLGRVFSVPRLAYQAEYENQRRFLGLDLLTGLVGRDHPFRDRLVEAGVPPSRLDRLRDEPCAPDLVGVDHYLTSDRFLDTALRRHPPGTVGGNGRHRYADTAAVHQATLASQVGFLPRLREVHARYGLPLAVTEAHAACTREEQVRWLCEAWDAAQGARADGVPVVAVTSWAMFGAVDWNSLLVRRDGHYENGAFDVRDGTPRRTAVGEAVEILCRDGEFCHPLLEDCGWWRGGGSAPWGLRVTLSGPVDHIRTVSACCGERGIGVLRQATDRFGHVRIAPSDDGGALRLILHHPGQAASALVHEVLHADELRRHAHQLLDRLIDASVRAHRSDTVPARVAGAARPASRRR